MKKRRVFTILLISGSGIVIILASLFVVYLYLRQVNANKRALSAPPTVQIQTPQDGDTFPAGESLFVHVTAGGRTTISEIQLWMDGVVVEKATNDTSGSGSFNTEFVITLEEGGHMLSARAVDEEGLVAQSLPVTLYGSDALAQGETQLVKPAGEGETLEDIAEALGMNVNQVKNMNPALVGGVIPTGTQVNLPGEEQQQAPEEKKGGDILVGPPPPRISEFLDKTILQGPQFMGVFTSLMRDYLPKAPSGLQAYQSDCKLILTWNDNSENEDYFNIWMSGLGVPERLIATVRSSSHTGQVWFQFDTPPAGIYSFWVEAVNALGSQPGEMIWAGLPATQCEHFTAAYLQMEITEMSYPGGYDRAYCYVSVENAPEIRVPVEKGNFFFITGGGDTILFGTLNAFTLRIPEDKSVDLSGECWGWMGAELVRLGVFTKSVPSSLWTGVDQTVDEPNFKITFNVAPAGSMDVQGLYTRVDPTTLIPYDLEEIDTGVKGNPFHPTDRILKWKWDGDEKEITGFTVYLNGNPYKKALASEREISYSPLYACGAHMAYEVAADLPDAQSVKSEVFEYDLNPCRVLAEVHFVSFATGWTNDGCFGPDCLYSPCDVLEAYYDIWASSAYLVEENYWGGNIFLTLTCNNYFPFSVLGDTDTLTVPIDPNDPRLRFGTRFRNDNGIEPDSDIVVIGEEIEMPIEDWPGYEKEFVYNKLTDDAPTTTVIRVKAYKDQGQ